MSCCGNSVVQTSNQVTVKKLDNPMELLKSIPTVKMEVKVTKNVQQKT